MFLTHLYSKAVLPDIKSQGNCGSCWAFSATASMEYAVAAATSRLRTALAEQEYLDCVYKDDKDDKGNKKNGCSGGSIGRVYEYHETKNRIGLMDDIEYQGWYFLLKTL